MSKVPRVDKSSFNMNPPVINRQAAIETILETTTKDDSIETLGLGMKKSYKDTFRSETIYLEKEVSDTLRLLGKNSQRGTKSKLVNMILKEYFNREEVQEIIKKFS